MAKPAETPADSLSSKGRIEVSELLRNKLLADPSFLSEGDPKSEEKIARALNVHKSALREAVIGFVEAGWLKRSEKGISHAELDFKLLRDYFGARLHHERKALRTIIQKTKAPRTDIAADLDRILYEQERLAECTDTVEDEDKRIQWFRRSMDLHVTLVRYAGFPGLARLLENILWCIRIGSCIPLEDRKKREEVEVEHRRLLENIRDSDDWPVDKFIKDHIREPMVRALEARGIIPIIPEGLQDDKMNQVRERRIEQCWNEVVSVSEG